MSMFLYNVQYQTFFCFFCFFVIFAWLSTVQANSFQKKHFQKKKKHYKQKNHNLCAFKSIYDFFNSFRHGVLCKTCCTDFIKAFINAITPTNCFFLYFFLFFCLHCVCVKKIYEILIFLKI